MNGEKKITGGDTAFPFFKGSTVSQAAFMGSMEVGPRHIDQVTLAMLHFGDL